MMYVICVCEDQMKFWRSLLVYRCVCVSMQSRKTRENERETGREWAQSGGAEWVDVQLCYKGFSNERKLSILQQIDVWVLKSIKRPLIHCETDSLWTCSRSEDISCVHVYTVKIMCHVCPRPLWMWCQWSELIFGCVHTCTCWPFLFRKLRMDVNTKSEQNLVIP